MRSVSVMYVSQKSVRHALPDLQGSDCPSASRCFDVRCSKKFIGIEQDGHRAVVHQLNGHVRLKDSRLDVYAKCLQRADEFIVERFALFRRRGLNEAWAPLAACVAVERKLRDGKNRAADVEQRTVHFALLIVEYTQVCDFFRHNRCRGSRVFAPDGYEHEQSGGDFATHAAVDHHTCAGHALHYGSHVYLLRSLLATTVDSMCGTTAKAKDSTQRTPRQENRVHGEAGA